MPTSEDTLGATLRGAMQEVSASFRDKYGILGPDGKKHLPLPPKGHPLAKAFARAVLRRAHQTTKLSQAQIARQVRKAHAILGTSKKKEAAFKEAGAALAAVLLEAPIGSKWGSLKEGASRWESQFSSLFRILEAKVDAEKGTARVVLIREGHGNLADRHWYTGMALQHAVGLFEGAKSYRDHPTPTEEKLQPERSVDRLAGFFHDAKFEEVDLPEGRVAAITATFVPQAGDQRVLSLLRTAEQFNSLVEGKGGAYIGFSINGSGGGEIAEIAGEKWNRVDQIDRVFSVDIVTEAGAGGRVIPGSFKESGRMPVKLNDDKLAESLKKPLSLVRENAIDGFIEKLGPIPDGVKAKLIEARKAAIEEDAEDGDAVTEAVERAIESAMEEADADGADLEEARRREGKTPALEEKGDNEGDATAGANGIHETDVDKMSEADAKAYAKKLQKAFGSKVTEAATSQKNLEHAQGKLRESTTARVLDELSIPDGFRDRLKIEIRERGLNDEKAIREHVQSFAKAFISRGDSAGNGGQQRMRESAGAGGKITVPKF